MIPGSAMKIGPYEIESEIARGGMGVVYKARSPAGTAVALKVVTQSTGASETGRIRFDRESHAARSVRHENIVQMLDAGRDRGTTFLVFELVEGGTLAQRVQRGGPLGWREAARVGAGIARGLAAIHAANLVHRDLKPANVLLDGDGEPKVADLGLVRDTSKDGVASSLTRTGELLGTPEFIAPEQADAARSVDSRADLYALGGTLFFLLTGEPPFSGNALTLVKAHILQPPPRPRSRNATVPPALDALVVRLLAKAPAERGVSAAAVARELDAIALGKARRISRGRTVALALVAIGGALAAAAPFVARGVASPPPVLPATVASTASASKATVVAPPPRAPGPIQADGEVRSVAISPRGDLVAVPGREKGVQTYDAATRQPVRLYLGPSAPVRAVCFSADGRWLGAGDESGAVWSFEVSSGIATQITAHTRGKAVTSVGAAVWNGEPALLSSARDRDFKLYRWDRAIKFDRSSDDAYEVLSVAGGARRVVYGTESGTVGAWILDEGPVRNFFERHNAPVEAIAITRDGTRAVSGSRDGTVKLWDATVFSDYQREPAIRGKGAIRAVAFFGKEESFFVADEVSVRIWPWKGGPHVEERRFTTIKAAAVTPDGRFYAVAEAKGVVHLVAR